jgi:NAD dependent epimerase/dehydratase family enzyme
MLASTLVLPGVLGGGGFQFAHPSLNEALVETIRGSAA